MISLPVVHHQKVTFKEKLEILFHDIFGVKNGKTENRKYL